MLIIDMPIPKDGGCHIAVDGGGHSFACPIKKKTCDYFFTKERPSWCPIKGVLPDEHGDLIDRDEMFEAINSRVAFIESCPEEEKSMKELFERDVLCTCLHDVVCAKAVIPAERKDMSRYIDAPDQTILTGSARTAKERTESMSKWITTSERNPSEYGNYLITKTDGDVDIGTYNPNYERYLHDNRGWSSCDAGGFYWIGDGVVAWMELPKAYGKDGESDERTD